MDLKLTKDTFAFKIYDNPFKKRKTESGILLVDGLAQSEETGELERLAQIIQFGVVTIIGPECKALEVGDGVFFDIRTPQPVVFDEPVWLLHEGSIRAYVKDDGTLTQLIEDKEKEAKLEQLKNSLALQQPLGATAMTAGSRGSGLTLVQ